MPRRGTRPAGAAGIELLAGIGIGVVVAYVLVSMVGTGVWQIAVIVALAMSAATLLDGRAMITIQSSVSAVVVATLYAPLHTSPGAGSGTGPSAARSGSRSRRCCRASR